MANSESECNLRREKWQRQTPDLTVAVQDYLKAIYDTRVGRRACHDVGARPAHGRQRAVGDRDDEAPRRARPRRARAYRGVALTEAGRRGALEVLRHHRLLERYLVDRLGLSLDAVHAEAELLEHALSEELEAKIDEELGFPTHDPHGDPIPDRDLRVVHAVDRTLLDLEPGARASISRVPDGDSELLRYLGELGLVPGSTLELVAYAPFGGPVTVRTQRGEHAISRELADRIAAA